jgi:hypothetical protein
MLKQLSDRNPPQGVVAYLCTTAAAENSGINLNLQKLITYHFKNEHLLLNQAMCLFLLCWYC